MKRIPVRVVRDETFENSYWRYPIQRELKRAFSEFEKQFPGVTFRIRGKIGRWDSSDSIIDSEIVENLPYSLVQRIPRDPFSESAVRNWGDLIKSAGIFVDTQELQRWEEDIWEATKGKDQGGQVMYLLGYFTGWLETTMKDFLIADLQKRGKRKDNEIVIGFTGKIFTLASRRASLAGAAVNMGRYAIIGIVDQPSYVILHELSHLFGARDIEDGSVASIMNNLERQRKTYLFDSENRKIVEKNLLSL